MTNWELPLVLFTVLSQAAVGILILNCVLEPRAASDATRKGLQRAGAMVFPLIAVALLLSLTHLGQPFAAYRALGHAGTSWLSREIWTFSILAVLTALYSHLCYKNQSKEMREAMGFLCALAGIIGLWMTAMVYALPARAAWTPFYNMLTFLGTALLLGGLLVALLVRQSAPDEAEVLKVSGWAAAAGLVLAVIALAGTAFVGQENPAAAKSVGLAVSNTLFWFRLLVGLLLPAGAVAALVCRAKDVTVRYAAIVLAAAVLGELAGRAVFYAAALTPSLWG